MQDRIGLNERENKDNKRMRNIITEHIHIDDQYQLEK